MKKTKLIAFLLLAIMLVGVLTGCANNANDTTYKIGIIQLLEHPALDAAYEGFKAGLEEAGIKVEYDFQNAQNDQSNAVTIANTLANGNYDLILAIATPTAQAMANATDTIPILITAVTDPKEAGLVEDYDVPGTNVSGTSDLTPIKEQIALLQEMLPDAKNIGILYSTNESNSAVQLAITKQVMDDAGLSYGELGVSNANEIQQMVQSAVGKYDALYTFTDNTIAGAIPTVALIANENKIPFIVGEQGMCESGGLATYGINYYNLGKQTATQAVEILKNGKDPATMPIQYLSDADLFINTDIAEAIGYEISDDLKARATLVTTKTN